MTPADVAYSNSHDHGGDIFCGPCWCNYPPAAYDELNALRARIAALAKYYRETTVSTKWFEGPTEVADRLLALLKESP